MDESGLLAVLQYADSFFPGGTAAFSWGLETLSADRRVAGAEQVSGFIAGQLRHRWATSERPALVAAWRAGEDLAAVAEVDRELETLSLAREMREGSRRAGAALINVHAKLGTSGAGAYQAMLRNGAAFGHLAAMQGLVWRAAGLDESAASAASAHVLAVGLLGAALRLGLIGHVEAQRILTGLRPLMARLLAEPAPAPLGEIGVYAPAADIAAMRHETSEVRLFAN